MTKPSKVLEALEKEMLWELDVDSARHGWVGVLHDPPEKPHVIAWSYRGTRAKVLEELVSMVSGHALAGEEWAESFPVNGFREDQLRWLRRNGYRAQKAVIKLVD